MQRFHVIQDAAAIIVRKSVFKQVAVYRRGDGIYIAAGGGYVRIYKGGNTGLPDVRWEEIDVPGKTDADMVADSFGKVSIKGIK